MDSLRSNIITSITTAVAASSFTYIKTAFDAISSEKAESGEGITLPVFDTNYHCVGVGDIISETEKLTYSYNKTLATAELYVYAKGSARDNLATSINELNKLFSRAGSLTGAVWASPVDGEESGDFANESTVRYAICRIEVGYYPTSSLS